LSMDFTRRLAVRFLLRAKLEEVYGNAFQDFFHDLMCARYPDFLDVKTAGQLGDMGSDGLSIVGRKLYSCYGPETVSSASVIKKMRGDLGSALEQRGNEFDTFTFVHSDRRGMHPVVASELVTLRRDHPELKFENFGFRRFRDEACKLEQDEVENLLGQQLPVQELVFRVELDEIEPLLQHLKRAPSRQRPDEHISPVSLQKIGFNAFGDDTQDELKRSIPRSSVIDRYYEDGYRVTERDEVAARFREEFEYIRAEMPNAHPDDIFYELELFVLGNLAPRISDRRAATVVLAYFFESCDIFDDAPVGTGTDG
jgi:hypothetical protein